MKSVYIHIPFCNNICSYCDFCKVFYNSSLADNYLYSLENEIKEKYKGEKISTIYIGGGTPSSLNITELERLFSIISIFKKEDNYEFTIECNFSSVDFEKLTLFKNNGVNRLSFGIESISKKNLELLEREENINVIKEKFYLARELGFNNINLDLMYAIPNESIDDLEKDINFIISLDPEHISTYSLILERNTKLALKNIQLVDEEIDYLMYNKICNKLKNKYIHYEISNFSKDGYESKHNLCYWNNDMYYGFGVGAASYLNNLRSTNTRSITKYINGKYTYENEKLTINDKMTYEMILGLRLLRGVNKYKFRNRYNKDIRDVFDIDSLLEKGLILENNEYIYISEDNMYISNEILINFIKE